jgi:hypothetical protein
MNVRRRPVEPLKMRLIPRSY